MKKVIIISFLIFFALSVFSFDNTERILKYESDVKISENGIFTVTEKITVVSAGENIKRGIYRDFPLRYTDKKGRSYKVRFDLLSVKRDGEKEQFHTQMAGRSIRIYIGDSDIFISNGIHEYEIIYETDRQMGYFKNFDEIYWNVNGNDWMFATEEIVCRIFLPEKTDMERLNIAGYTGYAGSTGSDFSYEIYKDEKMVIFRSTKPFSQYEGMTVAIGFPKGYVNEPGAAKNIYYIISDNKDILFSLFAFAAILIYFIYVWSKVGKDPEKGTIIPFYEPPKGFSAGEMRYTMKMSYDNKAFVSFLVSLAVKGFIEIEDKKGKYVIKKGKEGDKKKLDDYESDIYQNLFSSGDSFVFEQKNHLEVAALIEGVKKSLYGKCHGVYFNNNSGIFAKGVLFSAVTAVITFFLVDKTVLDRYIFSAFFMILGAIMLLIGYTSVKFLKNSFSASGRGGISSGIKAGCFSIIILPMLAFGFVIFSFLIKSGTGFVLGSNFIILGLIFINILFYRLMKAPTIEGRKVMDKIEGFKMYLMTTEKEKMYLYNPPKVDQKLFEAFLPFAIALDADYQWVESFEQALSLSGTEIEQSRAYSPIWFSGRDFNMSDFKTSFASDISSSVSRSSAAPGSSSGSSGGGSSGGGGGGGGGGGW